MIRQAERKHKKDKAEERHRSPLLKSCNMPMKLCLCGRCAGAFYNLLDHIMHRVGYDQNIKDKYNYYA